MSAAITWLGSQLPETKMACTSPTTNLVDENAVRQLSHSLSSCASSSDCWSVAATGACTVSVSLAVAPFGAVAITVIWNRTSAGNGGAVGVAEAVGVGVFVEAPCAVDVGAGCGAHAVSASSAAAARAAPAARLKGCLTMPPDLITVTTTVA